MPKPRNYLPVTLNAILLARTPDTGRGPQGREGWVKKMPKILCVRAENREGSGAVFAPKSIYMGETTHTASRL